MNEQQLHMQLPDAGMVSGNDEDSVFSRYSFGTCNEDEVSIPEEYDDHALLDLVERLRSAGALDELDEKNENAERREELTDDMIAQHLKSLMTNKWKKRAPLNIEVMEETDELSISEDDDSMSLSSNDSSDSFDTLEEGSIIQADYHGIDEVMKQLGVNIEAEVNNSSNLLWLSHVGKRMATLDYTDAPQTIASKRIWLANLAAELMLEDWCDDASVSTSVVQMDVQYQYNQNGLADQTRSAEKLIAAQLAATELDTATMDVIKPKRHWKLPQAIEKKPSATAELLAKQARALALKQQNIDTAQDAKSVSKKLSTCEETAATASSLTDPLRTRTTYSDKPVLPRKTTMAHVLRNKALAVNNMKPVPLEKLTKLGSSETFPPVAEQSLIPVESVFQAKSAVQEPAKPQKRPAKIVQSESAKLLAELVTIATIERSQQPPSQAPEKKPNVASRPNGLPPYPGYGPRWPWHPDSPVAPQGYRECYMVHMGAYYRQYMIYLETRATNAGGKETVTEEIMRASLSSQSSFRKALRTRKTGSIRVSDRKKMPVISPNSFASRPGRARKNFAVPVALPQIEEGSTSSSEASDPVSAGSPPSAAYKKLLEKRTKPDILTVGKVHQKSKGKVGKIIIASGRELDKQAKAQARQNRKQGKMTQSPEQPVATTCDQECACTIM